MNQEQLYQIKDSTKIIDYIFAGEAIITIQNEDSKNRFTFKIQKRRNQRKIKIDLYWVSVLVGPNNNDSKSYKFIGALSREVGFKHSDRSYIKDEALSVNVAYYYFNRLLSKAAFPLHSNVKTYHIGYCGRCGHLITTPTSIETGFGEYCALLLKIPYEQKKSEFQTTLFDQPNDGTRDYQIK